MHRAWVATMAVVLLLVGFGAAPAALAPAQPVASVSTAAATVYHVSLSVTASGVSGNGTVAVTSANGNGTVVTSVNGMVLSAIGETFGRTAFSFPGTYTGVLTVNGQVVRYNGSPVSLKLWSTDAFTLMFV